jgi:ABC-type uncharacterized transport system substrate-binding protein
MLLTPLAGAAPPGHTVRVGFFGTVAPTFDPAANPDQREFVEGLQELGYTLGRDVVVEYKSAPGEVKMWPQLAAELVSSKPDMLVTQFYGATPRLSRVAVLWNGSFPAMALQFENIEKASPQLGVILQSVRVTSSDDFDKAFAAIEEGHPDGLIVLFGPLRGNERSTSHRGICHTA